MSTLVVEELWAKIECLPEEDRLDIERRLAEASEVQWRHEAEEARRAAKEKGIDQATIDRAVGEVRYPT